MDVESQEALKVRRYHRRMASNVTHQPQSHSSMSMEICKLLVWTVILIKMGSDLYNHAPSSDSDWTFTISG